MASYLESFDCSYHEKLFDYTGASLRWKTSWAYPLENLGDRWMEAIHISSTEVKVS